MEGLLAVVGLELTTEGIRTTFARGEKNYENQSAFPKVVGNNVATPNLFTDGRGREKVVSAPPCTNNKQSMKSQLETNICNRLRQSQNRTTKNSDNDCAPLIDQ